jgi:hypothetical protein
VSRPILRALRPLALVSALAAGSATAAQAAALAYASPSVVTGAASVLGASGIFTTLVDAKNLGGGSAVTINGVQFAAATTESTDALKTFSGNFAGSTGNAGLDNLLRTSAYNNDNGGIGPTRLFLAGLTVGQNYRVQLFFVDDRPGFVRRMTVDGFAEVPVAVPQSLLGSFVADATTQVITIARSAQATGGQSQLNAYALFGSAVPEPSMATLTTAAGIAIAVATRQCARQRLSPRGAPTSARR